MVPDCKQEQRAWQHEKTLIIAVDEAGRGSLAGPVVACAFAVTKMTKKTTHPPVVVKDSKQLSARQREKALAWIRTHHEFVFATGFASSKTIDAINIRNANFKAMRNAIKKLETKLPLRRKRIVFVDGNETIPDIAHAQYAFVKGDTRIFSIACASIIAKVTRDAHMRRMAKKYPRYGFEIHKGYGTKLHRAMIHRHGLSPIHRKTFSEKFVKHYSSRES